MLFAAANAIEAQHSSTNLLRVRCCVTATPERASGLCRPDAKETYIVSQRIKLTEQLVRSIRAEYTGARGELKLLAKKYGVSLAHTSRICRGIIWQQVPYKNVHNILTAKRQDWRKIPGFPKYLVNSLGELWFIGNNKVGRGHLRPRLIRSTAIHDSTGKIRYMPRAVLVLLAFKGPSKLKKPHARHLDDNPKNNDLYNLAWGTAKQNYADGIRNGKHPKKGTPEAFIRFGSKSKGKPRTPEVRAKISKTKRDNPERQYYHHPRSPITGRFMSGASR